MQANHNPHNPIINRSLSLSIGQFRFHQKFCERLNTCCQKDADFKKKFGRILYTTASFLSYFQYWQGKQRDPEGWIYKSYKKFTQESNLTKSRIETIRKRLLASGLIEVKTKGRIGGESLYKIAWEHPFFEGLEPLKGKPSHQPMQASFFKAGLANPAYIQKAEEIIRYLAPTQTQSEKLLHYTAQQLEHQAALSGGSLFFVEQQFMYLRLLRENFQRYHLVTVRSFFSNMEGIDYVYEYKRCHQSQSQNHPQKPSENHHKTSSSASTNTSFATLLQSLLVGGITSKSNNSQLLHQLVKSLNSSKSANEQALLHRFNAMMNSGSFQDTTEALRYLQNQATKQPKDSHYPNSLNFKNSQ